MISHKEVRCPSVEMVSKHCQTLCGLVGTPLIHLLFSYLTYNINILFLCPHLTASRFTPQATPIPLRCTHGLAVCPGGGSPTFTQRHLLAPSGACSTQYDAPPCGMEVAEPGGRFAQVMVIWPGTPAGYRLEVSMSGRSEGVIIILPLLGLAILLFYMHKEYTESLLPFDLGTSQPVGRCPQSAYPHLPLSLQASISIQKITSSHHLAHIPQCYSHLYRHATLLYMGSGRIDVVGGGVQDANCGCQGSGDGRLVQQGTPLGLKELAISPANIAKLYL